MSSPPTWSLALACAGAILAEASAGRLHGGGFWDSPDTPTYSAAASAPDVLAQMRLPVYGWVLASWDRLCLGGTARAAIQFGCFAIGTGVLLSAMRKAGIGSSGVLAMGLSLVLSDLVVVWASCALPELLAHAALLFAVAAVLRIRLGDKAPLHAVLAVVACSLAWALKPAFLPFVGTLPLLVLSRQRGSFLRAASLLVLLLGPAVALSAVRAELGHGFRPVSFGGFQMSGIAGLMLTEADVERLSPAQRSLAREVLARRRELVGAGAMVELPLNSRGQRSFTTTAAFYFDILARQYDVLLWQGIMPLRHEDETWPQFDARLQDLAVATVRSAPLAYLAWIAGAASRLVGQAVVLNPAMMVACLALAWSVARRQPPGATLAKPEGFELLLLVNLVYFLTDALPQILLCFPASRYVQSAALMLPSIPACIALGSLCRDQGSSQNPGRG